MIKGARRSFKTNAYGWGALLLPQMEQNNVYEQLREVSDNLKTPTFAGAGFDHNEIVLGTYICPSCPMDDINVRRNQGKSNYVGVWGNGSVIIGNYSDADIDDKLKTTGIFYVNSKTTIGQVIDGTTNTFMIGERDGGMLPGLSADRPRPASVWIGSSAEFINAVAGVANDGSQFILNGLPTGQNNAYWGGMGSQHSGGGNFALADGSVQFVQDTISNFVYEAFGTRAGGEVASLDL